MSNVPTFYFPQPLASHWFIPLEFSGFEVDLDVEEQYTNIQNEIEQYRGGFVMWKGLKVALVPQLGFSTVRFLLGYVGQANAPLLDMVERVLLASGAKASQAASSIRCKKLYILSSEVSKDILINLSKQASFGSGLETPWYYKSKRDFATPNDYIGTIMEVRSFIDIYSGPVLDVLTDTQHNYVAIDYKIPFFERPRQYELLIDRIQRVLVELGATPLEFIQSP